MSGMCSILGGTITSMIMTHVGSIKVGMSKSKYPNVRFLQTHIFFLIHIIHINVRVQKESMDALLHAKRHVHVSEAEVHGYKHLVYV